jgi:S-formylglutathione hydrolase
MKLCCGRSRPGCRCGRPNTCGEAEFAHRGNDRLHEKLSAMGVPHVAELRAPGSQVGPMLAFVSAALAQEARRLM